MATSTIVRPRTTGFRATVSRWFWTSLSRGFDARVVVGPNR